MLFTQYLGMRSEGKNKEVPIVHLRLRTIRIERNLLLFDMARKLKMDIAYLSGIEHGRNPIPRGFFNDIYAIFNVTLPFGDAGLWASAERQIYELKERQEATGTAEIDNLRLSTLPLIERFEQGERSEELYTQCLDSVSCCVLTEF